MRSTGSFSSGWESSRSRTRSTAQRSHTTGSVTGPVSGHTGTPPQRDKPAVGPISTKATRRPSGEGTGVRRGSTVSGRTCARGTRSVAWPPSRGAATITKSDRGNGA